MREVTGQSPGVRYLGGLHVVAHSLFGLGSPDRLLVRVNLYVHNNSIACHESYNF